MFTGKKFAVSIESNVYANPDIDSPYMAFYQVMWDATNAASILKHQSFGILLFIHITIKGNLYW